MDISMSKTRMTVAITLSTLAICLTIATNPATSQARPVPEIAKAELSEPAKYKDVSKKKLEQERLREENTVVVRNDAKIKIEMAEVTVTPAPPPPPPEPEVPEVPEAPAPDQGAEPEPEVVEVSHQVETQPPPEPQTSAATSSVVEIAMTKVGFPYVWGAPGPSSFDCSGLVSWAYAQIGISLPHQSAAIAAVGYPVSSPQPGDLVYTPGHIGIYAGEGMVVEAATPETGVIYRAMWQDNPTYIRIGG